MPDSPKYTAEFLGEVLSAWGELAPDAEFAGLTLAQFKAKVKPSLDARAEVTILETQLKATRQTRNLADGVSNEMALAVINGVRSTPGYGDNSALYRALGYIPKDQRRSGLVRPSTPVPTLKVA